MISVLITLLLVCIVIYVLYLILGMIQLPPPIKTIVYLIVGLVLLVWFLDFLGIYHMDLGSRHSNNKVISLD